MLEDGKGELPFGRPIRWIVFLYGGRVVPFTILARRQRAGRPGAGRAIGRRHLRAPLPGHERARRPRGEGEGLRRLPQAPGRELRRARAQRASEPHRTRAGRGSPPPRRTHRDGAGRAVAAAGGAGPGRVSVRAVGPLRRGVPVAARGSADDDDDSPSALLPGAERSGHGCCRCSLPC